MDKEEMQKYSGEEYYRRPAQMNLPIIRLHGNKGIFLRNEQGDDGEWHETELGKEIEGTFLRVRRRLSFISDDVNMYTNEHNHPNERISLYQRGSKGGSNQIATGTGKELRDSQPRLRTQQILYMLLGDKEELVKLQVKGSSLGSKNKPEGSIPFYEYLNEFTKDKHIWEYKTKITSKEETGKLGSYYAMSFEKVEKCESLEKVGETLKYLHEVFETQKSYFSKDENTDTGTQTDTKPDTDKDAEEAIPVIDVEEESDENEIDAHKIFSDD